MHADDLREGLLDEAVQHCGDAQGAGFAVPFRDFHPLDRLRAVVPRFQLGAD